MQKFSLSAERVHLLQKFEKKEKDPIEILVCTIFSTLLFVYVHWIMQSQFRHEEWIAALILGPILVLVICLGLSYVAYQKLKGSHLPGQKRNLFVNLAVCSVAALVAGWILGDRGYWLYTTNILSYRDLVSYVGVDPAKDNGQSYMDAGHLYFKEHAYVLRQRFNKFQNGDTYCVAPIIRGSFKPQAGSTAKVSNGYVIPDSGTYDWWAVGTNCCDGDQAANFTCGEVQNPLARSGMRLLSDSQRPYYLLAVEEWSATYGLPVRHPLFFTWVKDPLETEDALEGDREDQLMNHTWYFLLGALIVSFLLHMVMHRNKIY